MSTSITHANLTTWLRNFATLISANQSQLTELDSAIGDADHGANMARGCEAVVGILNDDDAPAALMRKVGMALVSSVGGASGPLFGTFFLKFGAAMGSEPQLDTAALATAFRAGTDGVASRGKSTTGEKTMLDALYPACDALDEAVRQGKDLAASVGLAASQARTGAASTVDMLATKGRASYLGERSIGHQDPGATSVTYLLQALDESVAAA